MKWCDTEAGKYFFQFMSTFGKTDQDQAAWIYKTTNIAPNVYLRWKSGGNPSIKNITTILTHCDIASPNINANAIISSLRNYKAENSITDNKLKDVIGYLEQNPKAVEACYNKWIVKKEASFPIVMATCDHLLHGIEKKYVIEFVDDKGNQIYRERTSYPNAIRSVILKNGIPELKKIVGKFYLKYEDMVWDYTK